MVKNFKLQGNYVVLEVENLYDLQVFCVSRKIVDYEIINFWHNFARGAKNEFALTISEFKHFYLEK